MGSKDALATVCCWAGGNPCFPVSSGIASISYVCLAEARRPCVPGGTRTSVAGSGPGVEVRKDNGSTHSVSLGEQRVLQGNSSLLLVALGLPELVHIYFSPKQMTCLVKGRIQATPNTLLLKSSHLGSSHETHLQQPGQSQTSAQEAAVIRRCLLPAQLPPSWPHRCALSVTHHQRHTSVCLWQELVAQCSALIRRMGWVHGHINPPGVRLRVTQLFKLLGGFPLVVLLYGLYGVKGPLVLKGLKDLGLVCLWSLKIP